MLEFLLNVFKIIFLLGLLILIHEAGHFTIAKICKVKVIEFSIGFGKILFQKQGKETKYVLRMIPLGGFCNMADETNDKNSFINANIWKKIAIVIAGPLVNIIFGLLIIFMIFFIMTNMLNLDFANRIIVSLKNTGRISLEMIKSFGQLFTSGINPDEMVGIVGISEIVVQAKGLLNYMNLMAMISISLGFTNLLPIPALDGGKLIILIIELIRRKPMKIETEQKIQLIGFAILLSLTIFVTYKDIARILVR